MNNPKPLLAKLGCLRRTALDSSSLRFSERQWGMDSRVKHGNDGEGGAG